MRTSSSNFGLPSIKIGYPSTNPPPDGRHSYPVKTSPIPSLPTGHPPVSASSPGQASHLPTGHPPFRLKSWSASLPPSPRYAPILDLKSCLVTPPRLGTRYRPLKSQSRSFSRLHLKSRSASLRSYRPSSPPVLVGLPPFLASARGIARSRLKISLPLRPQVTWPASPSTSNSGRHLPSYRGHPPLDLKCRGRPPPPP
ncbi:hypothetical protein CF319_g8068 [Tilletia indica]|nr:hypothetical protein CF319_g8068 [Tilletia indica]